MAVGRQRRWWPDEGDEPDPRFSLANERTLLAYNRTGLAFLVAGLAVAGSRAYAETSVWFALMGLPLIVLGGAVALVGRQRFLAAQRAMRLGLPLSPPGLATLVPVAVATIAVLAVVVGTIELARH